MDDLNQSLRSESSQMKATTHDATYTEYSDVVTERQVGMAKGPGQWGIQPSGCWGFLGEVMKMF